jgi:hypothetical protein
VSAHGASSGAGHAVVVGDSFLTRSGAFGGQGGAGPSTVGTSGDGGNATSESVGVADDSTVTVYDLATGGAGGPGNSIGGRGGAANSSATGSNTGPSAILVKAEARGGRAGGASGAGKQAGVAGSASVTASGTSSGGADVTVSAVQRGGVGGDGSSGANAGGGAASEIVDRVSGSTSGTLHLDQQAFAGAGGNSGTAAGGRGGNASSILSAVNPGGGAFSASASSTAGFGGTGATAGAGGDATTSVIAQGNGPVTASSSARGGSYGSTSDPSSRGGNATALASATGVDNVTSRANAYGGSGLVQGAAIARSSASGSNASVVARANSGGAPFSGLGPITGLVTNTEAYGSGSLEVESQAFMKQALSGPPPTDRDVFGIAIGSPDAGDVARALAGNPNASAAIPNVLGMALLGAKGDTSISNLSGEIEYDFDSKAFQAGDRLTLALMNVSVLGQFDTLHFRVAQNGSAVVDMTFTDVAAVLAFFDDAVLPLGKVAGSNVLIDWALGSGSQTAAFNVTTLLGVVPEPSTGLLLGQGLLLFAVLRRTRVRCAASVRRRRDA